MGKLISNTGQSGDALAFVGIDRGQPFTTGSHKKGYTLTHVDFSANTLTESQLETVTVRIESSATDLKPAGSLGTLSVDTYESGLARFTSTGIDLDPDTTYVVVWESTSPHGSGPQYHLTNADAEDSGGATGWSINNNSWHRNTPSDSWAGAPRALKLAIRGFANSDLNLLNAAVTNKALMLTYDRTLDQNVGIGLPDLSGHFTVKVAGSVVEVANVTISGKAVTLTLAEAVVAGQAVTVSYSHIGQDPPPIRLPGSGPAAPAFADRAVTNHSTNRAPSYVGTPLSSIPPSPPVTLVSFALADSDFSDPDGDALTISISAKPDNVLQTGENHNGTFSSSGFFRANNRVYFATRPVCELLNVRPALTLPIQTTITITATDPDGAAAHLEYSTTATFGTDACPLLQSAELADSTLTLTYLGVTAADDVSVSASEFAVTVDGRALAVESVAIGTPTPVAGDNTKQTTTVTLTLAEPVGANQDVTVSHTPSDDPTTTGFTDQTVTFTSSNRAPTATIDDPEYLNKNAPPGQLVHVPVTLADLDSDTFPTGHPSAGKKLHITWEADRPEVLNPETTGYVAHPIPSYAGFYLQVRPSCELRKLNPPPPALFETTVAVAATDPTGVSVGVTAVATTQWAPDECPMLGLVLSGGGGEKLRLIYNQALDEGSVPPANLFMVKADGTAVDLAESGAVAVAGNAVILTLAEAVESGQKITVSYTPPSMFGGIHSAAGHAAGGFEDEAATVDLRRPALLGTGGATVQGTKLTLTYDEALDPVCTAVASQYNVDVTTAELDKDGNPIFYPDVVTAVAVDSRRVVLTLGRLGQAVAETDTVTLIYNLRQKESSDDACNLRDLAGNDALPISPLTVTHGPPPTMPTTPTTPPPGGGGGGVGGPGPGDTAPDFGTAQVASLTLALGEAMTPVVLPQATGGDGALTYSLASEPAGLAGLTFDAATRRLSGTPDAAGDYEFTYTAHDADANRADTDAAVLTFAVTVEDPRAAAVKRSVRRTLSAVARRSLTSALDNIGARFAASVPASGLTLAGHAVPLGTAAGTSLADMDGEQFCLPGTTDGFGTDREHCAFVTRGMTSEELLHASSFSLTMGAAGGSENTGNTGTGTPPSPQWAVWGRGDLGTFAGRPEPGMGYEGELQTGWLGMDARAGAWVMGLALSHGTGEADYDFADGGVSGEGRLETSLTALYPYGRWTLSEGLELRGVLGAGSGEARHWLDGGADERSDLSMWMGSLGLRREFPSLGEIDLALRADASLARMETGDGTEHIANLTADSWRLRAGVEASRRFALDGESALEPFVEAAARQDGGDGLEGTGLEIAGGVRYTAPRLHIEMRGRWLASHSEEGAEESGVSVTARLGPGARGRGLSLSLSPRWGAGTGGAEALWRDELPGPAGSDGTAAMDARIGYGFSWTPGWLDGINGMNGLLTPFAETGISGQSGGDSRRLRLGARFEAPRMNLGMELAGERLEGGASEPEHALRLDIGLRF